jgi:hypothetical protein
MVDEAPLFEPNHDDGVLPSSGGSRAKGRKKRRVSFGACIWRMFWLHQKSIDFNTLRCFAGSVNERLFDMNSPTRRRLDCFESASDYAKWAQWPFKLEEVTHCINCHAVVNAV